ncbi:hypothetical protein SDRG_00244 [Saprolegnia diclina VS20]|uniref:WD repeat-containing protein 75 second beta-propeller domain-containing protein n=1 Tax=Saprolegnia diclina (strain VS20) TaxID=1156394 RepID=T0R6H9_SAPDV|nr:hypothetical protein SDRG_00244 [Saprolegnia diclina VS20]EQC42511.1 hypothetical protein SDRG_00244 [Saprolegnia diclina VS20]|eukprot:XP_008603934.1 hypothetical protein SDRG_00244 [Saprolegnia diclina VS20]
MAQKLSSACTRAQRCLGITASTDGKSLYEAHGDAIVARSAKTGEIVQYLRMPAPEGPPEPLSDLEVLRRRMRDTHLKAHFERLYKNPSADKPDATRKAQWVSRQVAKYAIPTDVRNHVSAFALHPTTPSQMWVATGDCHLRLWDLATGQILADHKLKDPIVWIAAISPELLAITLNTTVRSDQAGASQMCREKKIKAHAEHKGEAPTSKKDWSAAWTVNLHPLEATHWNIQLFDTVNGYYERKVMSGQNKPFVGAAYQPSSVPGMVGSIAAVGGKELQYSRIYSRPAGDDASRDIQTRSLRYNRYMTSVALHPTRDEVVTGDVNGQIQVWRSLTEHMVPEPTKLHWHSHPVGSVAYSTDGNYVASGGEEFVFVLWHLESGKRTTIPRFPASISSIVTRADGAGYYVATVDNSIIYYKHVADVRAWHVGGLARVGLPSKKTLINGRLALEPWSQTLALQGASLVGNVQLYEPLQDRVLRTVPLTERNQVSATFNEVPTRTFATHIGFSNATRTMATVARTQDESVLRFWTRKTDGSFVVNTDVDQPHGLGRVITAIGVHNTRIATGDDHGEVRVWALNDGVWSCASMSQFRKVPVGAIAFSDDGSLLAIAYGPLLTLWDPITNALRSVLSYPKEAVADIAFAGPSSPLLVARTSVGVYVWSLLTCSIVWFYAIPFTCMSLTKTSNSSQLLLGVNTGSKDKAVGHLFVFDTASSIPTAIYRVPGVVITDALFYKQHLLVMDAYSTVHAVGDAMLVASLPATMEEESNSILQQMYGAWTVPEASTSSRLNKEDASKAGNGGMFAAPSHVLPPLRSLYRSFLDTVLTKAKERAAKSVPTTAPLKRTTTDETPVASTKKAKVDDEAPEATYAALKKVFSQK